MANCKRKFFESLVTKAKKREHLLVSEEPKDCGNDEFGTTETNSTNGSFTVIGSQKPSTIPKVRLHWPGWLSHPISLSTDLKTSQYSIDDYHELDKTLLHNLTENGITHFFPVQHEILSWMLNDISRVGLNITDFQRPRDLCVLTPTGSGKTLAYVLPIIQCLSARVVPKIRALIVAPVQELVIQIANVFQVYSRGTNLRVELAVGGRTPLPLEQSKFVKNDYCDFESCIDILVTTPGRLVEHLENTEGFDLQCLRFLVLDECDRLLNNVQNDWIYHLEKHFAKKGLKHAHTKNVAQKLLLSATLSQDPEHLAKVKLFQPVLFSIPQGSSGYSADNTRDIGSFMIPSGIKERYIVIETVFKPIALCALLVRGWRRILCFTKSGLDAHKLCKLLSFLQPDLKIREISSRLKSSERERILKEFHHGSVDMLVCSDVMTRGIDIENVKYVVSYDPPKYFETYIHRVGRTGRAGKKGKALTLLSPSQAISFDKMLNGVNKTDVKQMVIDKENLIQWKPEYKAALQKLKAFLKEEKLKEVLNVKKEKIYTLVKRKKCKKKRQNREEM